MKGGVPFGFRKNKPLSHQPAMLGICKIFLLIFWKRWAIDISVLQTWNLWAQNFASSGGGWG
jgi:hypothetical protein